jgi:hypothetical protein
MALNLLPQSPLDAEECQADIIIDKWSAAPPVKVRGKYEVVWFVTAPDREDAGPEAVEYLALWGGKPQRVFVLVDWGCPA